MFSNVAELIDVELIPKNSWTLEDMDISGQYYSEYDAYSVTFCPEAT